MFNACIWPMALGRDLLRLTLALGGDLPYVAHFTWYWGFWPPYVDAWIWLSIPLDVVMVIWAWRQLEWKR